MKKITFLFFGVFLFITQVHAADIKEKTCAYDTSYLGYQMDFSYATEKNRSKIIKKTIEGIYERVRSLKIKKECVVFQEPHTIHIFLKDKKVSHINKRILKNSKLVFKQLAKKSSIEDKKWQSTALTGQDVSRIESSESFGRYQITLTFTARGSKLFEKITERNVGTPIALFLNGKIISQPIVNEKITDGKAVITGKLSKNETKNLMLALQWGTIPVPLKRISE